MRLLSLFAFLPSILFSQPVYQHLFPLNGKEVTVNSVRSMQGDRLVVGGRVIDKQTGEVTGFLAKMNGIGELIFSREMAVGDGAFVWDVLPTPDGGVLAAISNYANDDEGVLVHFDGSGQWVYSKKANGSPTTFFRLLRLADGNVLVAGSGPAGSGNSGGLLMKVNNNGQVIWSQTCTSADGPLEFRDVYEDEQGFLYAAGVQFVQGSSAEAVFGRFSPTGEPEWLRRPGFSPENRFFRIVPFDGGTSLLLGGHTQTASGFVAVWLCNVKSDGTLKWMNTYGLSGTNLFLYDLIKAPGVAYFTFAEGGDDPNTGMGVARVNTSGDLLSVKNYDPQGRQGGTPHMALTDQNELLLADGVLEGQQVRCLYTVRTDIFGNVPPCCLLSGNMQVAPATPDWEYPAFASVDGPSLLNHIPSPNILDFENFFDLCPVVNTDFSLSDSLICPGECITLTLTNPTPGAEYSWLTPGGAPDAQNPNLICYAGDGTFGIVPVVNGCAQNPASQTIVVNAADFNVPTAFTPDGDGTNDVFRPLIVCPVTDYSFSIYNRWGQKVFETTDPDEAWDGRSDDNSPAVSDVYVWKLSYRAITGEASERKGQVSLVR